LITSHSRLIKENYDDAAQRLGEEYEYERWGKNVSARRDYEQTLRSLLYHIRNRRFKNALEIGCGVGTWTVHLRKCCDSITVADISQRMVEITISRLRRLNFRNISGIVCDLQKSCLMANNKYDAVFCIRAIEYMEDKISALSNMYKLLNHDGFAFIITKNPHRGLIPFISLITKKTVFRLPKLFAHEIHYKNLLILMRKVGFTNVDVYPTIVSYPIASYDTSRSLLIEKNEAMLSNVIFDSIYKKRLNPFCLPLQIIESYCVTGRK
jgi:ubiquinone/menaquinone biosynthesis C-methylase UbiE